MRVLLLAGLLLAACLPDLRTTAPAYQDGTSIWWNGFPPIPGVGLAAEIVLEDGLAICPADRSPTLEAEWEPAVYFEPISFECGDGFLVDGCQPYPWSAADITYVLIGWQPSVAETALCAELGHVVWETCLGRTGETITLFDDGGGSDIPDEDYAGFVERCRADVARLPPDGGLP